MKLVSILTTMVCAFLVAIDSGGAMLSSLGHALGLHEAPISSALAVLGILYLVVIEMRHLWHKKGGA